MLLPSTLKSRFFAIWERALVESTPNPTGAIGELMSLLEDCFDVEQIQHAVLDNFVTYAVAYLFDFGPLGFSGMGYNVFVISRVPADEHESRAQANFLAEQKHATDSLGFCFHLYLSNSRPAKNPFVVSTMEAVFLCGEDLSAVFSAPIPKAEFIATIRRQIPVSLRCPFNTNREALGAMFVGRRSELGSIVESLDTSMAIEGARRIGKTSLMREAYTILRNRHISDWRQRVFYFVCHPWTSYAEACRLLAHRIDIKREQRLDLGTRNIMYMFERCSHGGARPLLLFLDEVDQLIDIDSERNWQFFNLLATLKEQGMVRFVVAGYRSISKLVRGQDSRRFEGASSLPRTATPFLQALEIKNLGPLSRKESDHLLAQPLKNADVQIFDEPEVVQRVWKATAGYPFLVQFFGQRLFNRAAERTNQAVTCEDVAEVEESADLMEFLETHFIENTIRHALPVVQERSCAFLFAHSDDAEWTEQDFAEACRESRVPLGRDPIGTIHRAVKSLTDAQILGYSHGKYTFAFPVMRQVLTHAYPNCQKALRSMMDGDG